jgi:hypothetical protein
MDWAAADQAPPLAAQDQRLACRHDEALVVRNFLEDLSYQAVLLLSWTPFISS